MKTKNIAQLTLWSLLAVLVVSCGLQFRQMPLYDEVETLPKPEPPKSIASVVDPIIFDGDPSDAWGLETDACKEIKLAEQAAKDGGDALDLTWNRTPEKCEWAGMGIGWEEYQPKDLTSIMDVAAIQLHVRSQEGTQFGLPIVLTLEDYAEGRTFAYTGNGYFERTLLDDDWQYITVPLSDFDPAGENFDPTNVKSLNLELQGSGQVLIDRIELIPYEPAEQEPWIEENIPEGGDDLPKILFDDAFPNDHVWGLMRDDCQDFQIVDQGAYRGDRALSLEWDNSGECNYMVALGMSWNQWYPLDYSKRKNDAVLEFYLKNKSGSGLPVRIRFQDYGAGWAEASISDYLNATTSPENWRRVAIPLSTFSGDMDWRQLKQLVFYFDENGAMMIDEIKLVEKEKS